MRWKEYWFPEIYGRRYTWQQVLKQQIVGGLGLWLLLLLTNSVLLWGRLILQGVPIVWGDVLWGLWWATLLPFLALLTVSIVAGWAVAWYFNHKVR